MSIPEYTQGICADGAVILVDGLHMPVDLVVSTLNRLTADIHKRKADLESCCKMVIDAGLVTGHADTVVDLMREVLVQAKELRDECERLNAELAERRRRMALLRDWKFEGMECYEDAGGWGDFVAAHPEAAGWFDEGRAK